MALILNKSAKFEGVKGPVLTIVMDGVGLAPDTISNAVAGAYTPNLDALMANYPMVALKAHGTAVGIPSDDDMGNSEVGHNALGAGQVFAQGAKLVSNSIESGKIFASETWQLLVSNTKDNDSTLHFLGLFSDGNVHSHIDHLKAMLAQAKATDGSYDMEKFLQIVVNYVFYFVEILAEYPIATIAQLLPTLAYFIVGDGLNEVVSNLLSFVMVLIERLGPVLSVDVNDLGAGLMDYLGTKDWSTFQEIFKFYEGKDGKKYFDEITYDADGNIVRTPHPAEEANISLTEALLSFVANIKIDMAGIYGYDEPYFRTITAFINADAENAAWDIINANTNAEGVTDPAKLEEARKTVYDAAKIVDFDGKYYRKDIGLA